MIRIPEYLEKRRMSAGAENPSGVANAAARDATGAVGAARDAAGGAAASKPPVPVEP
jgi:hypothetical protein